MYLGFQLFTGLQSQQGVVVATGEDDVWGLGPDAMSAVRALRDFGSQAHVKSLQPGAAPVRLRFGFGAATDAAPSTGFLELSLFGRRPTARLRRRWDASVHAPELAALWAGLHQLVRGGIGELKPLFGLICRSIGHQDPPPAAIEACLEAVKALQKELGLEGEAPVEGDLTTAFGTAVTFLRRRFGRPAGGAVTRLSREFQAAGPTAVFASRLDHGTPADAPLFLELLRLAAARPRRKATVDVVTAGAVSVAATTRVVFAGELLAVQSRELRAETAGTSPGLYDRNGGLRARLVGSPAMICDAAAGAELLRTVVAHRLIRRLVHRAYDQREAGEQDFRVVRFEGGWQGLAAAVDLATRDWQPLQRLAIAGQAIQWRRGDGGHSGGGWWTWDSFRGTAGRPGWVQFTLGGALLPGYATELRERDNSHSLAARQARRLVPELRYEPPVAAINGRNQGPAWTLSRLFVLEVVDRAEELAKRGAVRITAARWTALSGLARFPSDGVSELIGYWGRDESERAPALVERQGEDFTFGPRHHAELDFIVASGQARLNGRVGGQAANARRFRRQAGR